MPYAVSRGTSEVDHRLRKPPLSCSTRVFIGLSGNAMRQVFVRDLQGQTVSLQTDGEVRRCKLE